MGNTPCNNLNELKKLIKSEYGQKAILTNTANESQIKLILKQAGNRLEALMKEELQAYFDSYEPVEYLRTGYTMESFRVSEPIKTAFNSYQLKIYFNEGLANHPSYISDNQPDGYTPWLLNVGWKTKMDDIWNIDRFTRFSGTNYITKAVERFNKENILGLKVHVYYNGNDVTGINWNYGMPF